MQEGQPIAAQRTEDSLLGGPNKAKQRGKLHLFNCARTNTLDAVEDLLNATKAKSRFESVEKHYFSLSQIPKMCTEIIPKLQMDMAFFVVDAYESWLSICQDNAGVGYAMIYRVLLKATGVYLHARIHTDGQTDIQTDGQKQLYFDSNL